MGTDQIYKYYQECTGVSIDSRTVQQGDLFIGISGPNFDGDQYAQIALDNGAKYAVVNNNDIRGTGILQSDLDGVTLLTELARKKRSELTIPVIALTGSNGKTTTKELLHAVLSTTYITHATQGNLNNHLGVPLTILRTPDSAEILLVEMGANHQREIAHLAQIARPTIGLITNIGKAHLEGFGGEEGVYIGKKELFDYLSESNGLAFVNGDDAKVHLASQCVNNRILYAARNTFVHTGTTDENMIHYTVEDQDISYTQLTGLYNLSNIAVAICVGRYFDIHIGDINSAICNYQPTNNRSQLIRRDNTLIIMDAYNANPDSMVASLNNLIEFNTTLSKKAILGEMLELGQSSAAEHQKIIDICHTAQIETILVGKSWRECESRNMEMHDTVDAIPKDVLYGSCTLIKGSRGVKLEKLLG